MGKILVKLPSVYVDIEWLRELCKDLKDDASFEYAQWKPRAALIDKNGGTSTLYTGQKYDSSYTNLVEDGWTHDHCPICDIRISDYKDENTVTSGYFNGFDWICKDCYEAVLDTDDIDKRINDLPKHEK